jgi:uncharacterized phage protein gp47/JayE
MGQTFDETITDLTDYVKDSIGNVDTRVGTVLRDAILAPAAFEFTNTYSKIDETSANQGINTAASQSAESLENLASNFGIARSIGTYASGTVRLFRYAQPTYTISIPSGTKAYTELSSSRVSFSTLATVYLTPSSPQDPEMGYYYVDCAVSCDEPGEIGNVMAGGISYIELVGIDGVTNPNETSGGTETQTNEQLVSTIESTARGNIGTRTGYEALVRENYSVTDVKVIGSRDADSVRAQYGSAVDVVVLDETKTVMTEAFTFVSPIMTTRVIPTFRPLISVIQITGKNSDEEDVTLVPGTDYTVMVDTYSVYKRSIWENSRILLHITSFTPLNNSQMIMDYYYTANIASIQNFLAADANNVFGSDVMAKAGISIPVNVTANIRIFPGYNATSVITSIETALAAFFNALLLDDDVQASDVIATIANVAGVDAVDVPTFSMAKVSAPAVPLQEILVGRQEYVRMANDYITVVG